MDWFGIREREGNYVQFIAVTNFLCAWLYLIAVYGMLHSYQWASRILGGACFLLAVGFIALLVYIDRGGVYETKTVGAMIFRFIVTALFTALAYYLFKKKNNKNYKILNT